MEIKLSKHFLKRYSKLTPKLQLKTKEALDIFTQSPFNYRLHKHPLQGRWAGFRSIDITGDFRAVYLSFENNVAKFYDIDTHGQLYG